MLFNSLEFMIFFPIVCLGYYVIPHKARYLFLLACSYFFYMCWNPGYALLLLTATAVTYGCGLLLGAAESVSDEKKKRIRKKLVLALTFLINLGILFFFKYFNFAAGTLVRMLGLIHISLEAAGAGSGASRWNFLFIPSSLWGIRWTYTGET